jgi:DNA-binding CsgD family transcriptional regulator
MSETDISNLELLTAKQREVLDLLIEHKSSKEIARELGISPHTVDQRVQFAKEKLGVATRNGCAVEYRRLIELSRQEPQRSPNKTSPGLYEETPRALAALAIDPPAGQEGEDLFALKPVALPKPKESVGEAARIRVVPRVLEGRHGTFMRLSTIVLMTVLLLFIALGGVAFFEALSREFEG